MDDCDERGIRPRALGVWGLVLSLWVVGWGATSCRSSPSVRHYQPDVVPEELNQPSSSRSDVVLALQDFSANSAYDEQRIVYRENSVQINYYHYHRWASPPGLLVGDTLQQIYQQTDRFRAVIGGYDSRAHVVLGGRVIKFEEFDISDDEWKARVVLDLRLRDAVTGELLWDTQVTESIDLEERSPLGVAQGMSLALTRIGRKTVETIVDKGKKARQRQREREQNKNGMDGDEEGNGGDDEMTRTGDYTEYRTDMPGH